MAPSFKVLIVGAGFGGVTLAVLLERANIDYEIFESAAGVSPLGGAVVLGPTVMPLLEQLGLLEKVQRISKPIKTIHLVQENMKRIGEINLSDHKRQTGYDSLVATRSELLSLLVAQIPTFKIHFSKCVLSFAANKDEVVVRCTDDTSYRGEILVGADGAFSRIRELLYRQVAKKGILPRSDAAAVAADAAVASFAAATALANETGASLALHSHGHHPMETAESSEAVQQGGRHISLVGVTRPLDSDAFPIVKGLDSHSHTIIGDCPHYSWSYFAVPGNRICWAVNLQLNDHILQEPQQQQPLRSPSPPLDAPLSPTPSSRSSFSTTSTSSSSTATGYPSIAEFGYWESEDAMTGPLLSRLVSDDCKSFPVPLDNAGNTKSTTMTGTLGDFIDATPKDHIGRAITEQTLFETWHHGRTVLMGNACHRMISNAAHQGAVDAIQDAVALGNLIHGLPSASPENVVSIFKVYQADRYPHAKTQLHMSNTVGKLMFGKSWTEALMRVFLVRYMFKIYQHFCDDKILADRPQAKFLPMVESRGDVHALPQRAHKVPEGEKHLKH